MSKKQQGALFFSATDLADYEYCSLAWWHDHFEPLALADTDELFAHLVEMEREFDTQAPLQPDYQVIEQILKRRGAFEKGSEQHREYETARSDPSSSSIRIPAERARHMRRVLIAAVLLLLVAILFVAASLLVFR